MSDKENLPKGWSIAKFEDLLDYIQPTNYIVKSTEYKDTYKTPVLTAGKSFIKGYTNETDGIFNQLPTIIFDDFTTATQFVNFPFKVKSSAMKILQPTCDLVNIKLAYYLMQIQNIKGETHKRFWISEYSQLPVPLAPLNEQKRIIEKLEQLITDLDKGIEYLETTQKQLKVYRQAVLDSAFEGKLTNENLKEGELPKGWKLLKVGDVANVNPGLPNKENIQKNLEVQFIPMKLVEEIINKVHLTETRKYSEVLKGSYTPFINGDILFAKVTPCMENGKIAIVNNLKNSIGFGSSEFHVLRCSDKVLNKYLHRFIVQDKFRMKAQNAMTGAVGLRRVPKQFIENYLIPIPPTFEEQNKIILEIESRISVCEKIEESIDNSLLQAEALRLSIIKKAFEGKLVPQNPSDEPAEKLLERIRAAKGKEKPEKKVKVKKETKIKKTPKAKNATI
jgi:type I restriction enzyme S subunit